MWMKDQGLYRYLGINTHDSKTMSFIASNPGLCDLVLIDYNVLQLDREPIIKRLADSKVGVLAGTILAQGHLVRRKVGSIRSGAFFWYLARTLFKPSSRRLAHSSALLRDVLHSISGMTASQAAFAYVLSNSSIATCLFGTTNMSNLSDALRSSDLELDPLSIRAIRDAYNSLPLTIGD
jgi:aryl-alcohol dehydrogenase-like predicted oxidoreductase